MSLVRFRILLALYILLSAMACREQLQPELSHFRSPYSFFAIGHGYGHYLHVDSTNAPYPPFLEAFDQVKASGAMDFGVLLGDQVLGPTDYLYDQLDGLIAMLGIPVYLVPGNHDFNWNQWGIPLQGEFDRRYGPRHYSMRRNGDLFFILDSNTPHWNIKDEQLELVLREFQDLDEVRNIFFFVHNIIWWESDPNSLHNFSTPNSTVARDSSINFWSEIVPRLRELDQEVFFLAGDAGAWCNDREITYFHQENYHLIAQGMGCRYKDAALWIDVDKNGQAHVSIKPTQNFSPPGGTLLENFRYY